MQEYYVWVGILFGTGDGQATRSDRHLGLSLLRTVAGNRIAIADGYFPVSEGTIGKCLTGDSAA